MITKIIGPGYNVLARALAIQYHSRPSTHRSPILLSYFVSSHRVYLLSENQAGFHWDWTFMHVSRTIILRGQATMVVNMYKKETIRWKWNIPTKMGKFWMVHFTMACCFLGLISKQDYWTDEKNKTRSRIKNWRIEPGDDRKLHVHTYLLLIGPDRQPCFFVFLGGSLWGWGPNG